MPEFQPSGIYPEILIEEIKKEIVAYTGSKKELEKYQRAQEELDQMLHLNESLNQKYPESKADEVLERTVRFYKGIHGLKNSAEKMANLRDLYITYLPGYDFPEKLNEEINMLEDDAEIFESNLVKIICSLSKELLFSKNRIMSNK